jgi:hypothetical protein
MPGLVNNVQIHPTAGGLQHIGQVRQVQVAAKVSDLLYCAVGENFAGQGFRIFGNSEDIRAGKVLLYGSVSGARETAYPERPLAEKGGDRLYRVDAGKYGYELILIYGANGSGYLLRLARNTLYEWNCLNINAILRRPINEALGYGPGKEDPFPSILHSGFFA